MQDLATYRREQEGAVRNCTNLTIRLTECKTKLAALRQQRANAESSVRFASELEDLKAAQDRLAAIVADITAVEAERGRILMLQPRTEQERLRTTNAVAAAEAGVKELQRKLHDRRQDLHLLLNHSTVNTSWPPHIKQRRKDELEQDITQLQQEYTRLTGLEAA